MGKVAIRFPYRLDLEQVSALCVRRDGSGAEELVAVGDEDFAVLKAAVDDGRLSQQETEKVGDALHDPSGNSDWEAVATDATGRVFAIAESSAAVIVLSRSLRKQLHRIVLKAEEGPDKRARKLLEGDNRGPEGFLLRAGGHVLVVKQRKPILLIEFGPRQDRVRGLGAGARLGPDGEFELSGGDKTKLFPLHSWKLSNEEAVGSANDLAIDAEGRLYAISSRTYCIYEITPETDDTIVAAPMWSLPTDVRAGKDRNAEGLAFAGRDRPIVALDVKDTDDNAFVLERLPRRD
jgi:hypothetical protein